MTVRELGIREVVFIIHQARQGCGHWRAKGEENSVVALGLVWSLGDEIESS